MKATIKQVGYGSIAEEMGIEVGDVLLEINGMPVIDIMDYFYYRDDEELTLTIEKADGEVWDLEIEKDVDEDIGLEFTNPIIDCAKSCSNKCIFCFIDQMPEGMRETLYFKDDDSRLSFMMGNFVTLTNMSDELFARLIHYKMSPINISVHVIDPSRRKMMLGNKEAGKIKERLLELKAAGLTMNGQVVLLPEINDGKYLDETIEFLASLYPEMQSMAVVPVGMTKYRENLPRLKAVNKKKAREIIAQIDKWQKRLLDKINARFVYAADEFFKRAELAIPSASYYDNYIQIENGVGLIRKFEDAANIAIESGRCSLDVDVPIVATSTDAADMMHRIQAKMEAKCGHSCFEVVPIVNDYFGHSITVTGLITAGDLINQLKQKAMGRRVLIAENMRNSDGLFLDDLSLTDVKEALAAEIELVSADGSVFVNKVWRNL